MGFFRGGRRSIAWRAPPGAMVRRSEEDELPQFLKPGVFRLASIEACAARHQAPHAVPDDRNFFEFGRPCSDESFDKIGKHSPIGRDMEPRIVAQIDRRVSEIACQRRAVIVFLSSPVAVAQAQAVNENDDAAARPRQSRRKRFPGEMKLLSIGPERIGIASGLPVATK